MCFRARASLILIPASKCSVSKAAISRIKAQYDTHRPCSETERPKVLKNRDVTRVVRQVTLGVIESSQKASKIIGTTLDKPVSRSTIPKALHPAVLHAKKKFIKLTLTDRHKQLRFELRRRTKTDPSLTGKK
jgi:hypothetical protein